MMAASDDLKNALTAVNNNKNFVFEGKTYTPAQIVKQLTGPNGVLTLRAEQERQYAEAQAEIAKQDRNLAKRQKKQTKTALESARKKLDLLQKTKTFTIRDFANGEITEAQYNAYFAEVEQVTKDIAAMEAGAPAAAIASVPGDPFAYRMLSPQETLLLSARRTDIEGRTGFATPGQRTTPTPTVGGQRGAAPDVAAEIAGFRGSIEPGPILPVTEPTPTPTVGGQRGAAPKKVTRANVTAELTKRGLADTPENRAAVRADLEGKVGPVADWESRVAAEAGEYAYLLDPKYEGVPELLRKAVLGGWFKTDEGQKQFLQEFKATGYYRNTSQKQQLFDKKTPADKRVAVQAEIEKIRAEYGEIQLDQSALEEVATAAARNGASAVELGRLVYRAAFKRSAAQPAFGESVAAKTALGGEDVARVRAIYRAYGQKADDQTIARILAGEVDPASGVVMTEDMLRNNLRDIAKVSYAPFADLLDRGISVETIFQPYKNLAASVLEKNPEQIEMFQPNGKLSEFASALMGEKPMSLTEWMTELKSKEKYGWQFTNEAKQKATSLVMDLEKAFGFRA